MKQVILILVAGIIFSPLAMPLTPQQCAEVIQTNRESIDFLVTTISINEWASQLLLKPNRYGVWGAQWHGIQLRKESETITSIYYEFVHEWILPTLVFGYSLPNCPGIPTWLGQPHGWLYCESMSYDSFEPLEICCICDEKESRKRRHSFEEPVDSIKRPLIQHLLDTEAGMEWKSSQ